MFFFKLARLMQMSSTTKAMYFCSDLIGLPKKIMSLSTTTTNYSTKTKEEDECVVFKSIDINDDTVNKHKLFANKREDSFIFGRDDGNFDDNNNSTKCFLENGRADDDGVFIPNKDILFNLINQ